MWLVAGLLQHMLCTRPVDVGCVVDVVAMGTFVCKLFCLLPSVSFHEFSLLILPPRTVYNPVTDGVLK
jgi:hypothetical protein